MVVIQVVYAMVCVVGLCGNTLVIYVVLRFSKMQTVTNIYILMLAAADECFLVGKRYSLEIYSTLQVWGSPKMTSLRVYLIRLTPPSPR